MLNKLLNSSNPDSISPEKQKNSLGRGTTFLMTPGQFTKGSSLKTSNTKKVKSTDIEVSPATPNLLQDPDIDAVEPDTERVEDSLVTTTSPFEDVEDVVDTLHDMDEQTDFTPLSSIEIPRDEIGTVTEDLSSMVNINDDDEMNEESPAAVDDVASVAEDGSESSLMNKLMGDFGVGSDSVSIGTADDTSVLSEPFHVEIPKGKWEKKNKQKSNEVNEVGETPVQTKQHVLPIPATEVSSKPIQQSTANPIERSEDEKWKIYNVERKVNTLVKNVTLKGLSTAFVELEKLIEERPLSSRYLDCSEVQLCSEVIVRNAVQRSDFLPLAPCLLKMICDRQPIEFRQYFKDICDAKCKEFVTLSASDELLNNSGQNFCKLLGHLYALPRQMGDALFNIMHGVVGEYVERWSWLEDATVPLGGVREQEMAMYASALNCLLLEVTSKMMDNDVEVERGMEKFVWYMRESLLNGKVPRKIREIYLDGFMAIQKNSSEDVMGQNEGLSSCTNSQDDSEVEITAVVPGVNNSDSTSSESHEGELKKFEADVDFENLGNPPINTIAMAPTNAFVNTNHVRPVTDIFVHRNHVADGGSMDDDSEPDIIVEDEYSGRKSIEQMMTENGQHHKPASLCSSDGEQKNPLPLGRGRGMACLDFHVKETTRPVANVLPIGYNSCIGNAKGSPVRDQFDDSPQRQQRNRNHKQPQQYQPPHQPQQPTYNQQQSHQQRQHPQQQHRQQRQQNRQQPQQQQQYRHPSRSQNNRNMRFRPVYHNNENNNRDGGNNSPSQHPGVEKVYHPDGRLEYIPKPEKPPTGGFGSKIRYTCMRCNSNDHSGVDCPHHQNLFF